MPASSKPVSSGPIEPAKHKRTHAEREQMPTGERASHAKAVATQLLFGVTAQALLTFVCVWLGVSLTATALAYLVDRSHDQYAGKLDEETQFGIVAGAHGRSGPNRDYVINTARHLAELAMPDALLARLASRLEALQPA